MSSRMLPPVLANPCSSSPCEQASAATTGPAVGGLHPLADVTGVDVAARREAVDELERAVEAARGVDPGDRAARVERQPAVGVAPGAVIRVVLERHAEGIDRLMARPTHRRRGDPRQPFPRRLPGVPRRLRVLLGGRRLRQIAAQELLEDQRAPLARMRDIHRRQRPRGEHADLGEDAPPLLRGKAHPLEARAGDAGDAVELGQAFRRRT